MSKKVIAKKVKLTPERIQELKESFDLFDKDGDHVVTGDEIYRIMKGFGNTMKKSEIKEQIAKIDLDGDGSLNFEEFCTFMEYATISASEPPKEQKKLRAKKNKKDKDEDENAKFSNFAGDLERQIREATEGYLADKEYDPEEAKQWMNELLSLITEILKVYGDDYKFFVNVVLKPKSECALHDRAACDYNSETDGHLSIPVSNENMDTIVNVTGVKY